MFGLRVLILEQGTLTIVRRTSGKNRTSSGASFESSSILSDNPEACLRGGQSLDLDEVLDNVDLATDTLPSVETPDACVKAALRYKQNVFRQTCTKSAPARTEVVKDTFQYRSDENTYS